MGTVGIQMTTQPILVAPAPIWLEATNPTGFEDEVGTPIAEPTGGGVWDETYHKITYVWTVEEETSPGIWTRLSAPYPRVINMVTDWNEAYVAYGKRIAFRLPGAGTYRFQLWCIDMQGNQAVATSQTVTVQTPAQAFSPADTIVCALDGDFTGAPAASQQVTSMAAVNSIIQSASSPKRVSFKNGDVHDGVTLRAYDGFCDLVDTWDNSAATADIYAPRGAGGDFLGHFAMNDSSQSLQCTFDNIGFKGHWDDRTETGDDGDASVFETRFITAATKFMCYNCDFVGLGTTWLTLGDPFSNGAAVDRRFMIADCINTSFRNYGFYSYYNNGGEYDFLGCSIYRNHDALAGPAPIGYKVELRNDHGPVRLTSYQHTYMACCDFFGCSGWSAGPFGPSANGNVRLFAGTPETTEAPSLIVDRCVNEGGYITWKLDGQDESAPEVPGNWLFDKVLTLCTARTQSPWALAMGGATRRNCYTWAPDIPYYDRPGGFDNFVRYVTDGGPTGPANFAAPMLDYNNTDLTLNSGSPIPLSDGNETAWSTHYARENSIFHEPNATTTTTPAGPINILAATEAVPGVTPRFSGVRWNYQLIIRSNVNVPNGDDLLIPYADIDSSDGLGNGDTSPTTQAYWQALPASDDQHGLFAGGSLRLASRGDFSVSYDDASNVRITNTSGDTWSGTVQIHLDRKSRLATDLPAQTQYASPSSVPMPRPQTGSSALGAADIGYVAYDDFLGRVRSTPKTAGAVEV